MAKHSKAAFAKDSVRFQRLMTKAEQAIQENRWDDAKRYLLMCGDMPGFGKHPRRRHGLIKAGQQPETLILLT